MSKSTIIAPFPERKFLLFMLSKYEEQHGNERRFLPEWEFGQLSSGIKDEFPELQNDEGQSENLYTQEWFKEAIVRGLVEPNGTAAITCKFTEHGYVKARRLKHPVKHFLTNHWAWVIGIALTLINVAATLVRLAQC